MSFHQTAIMISKSVPLRNKVYLRNIYKTKQLIVKIDYLFVHYLQCGYA